MKELSLNILDITENSVKAGALLTKILITEDEETLSIVIEDNGCGMSEEVVRAVTDPFYTTRTTRPVGMGIPLLKMEAEMTGGSFRIESVSEKVDYENRGTRVEAGFFKNHIDFIPLGDVISTVTTLIQGHPDRDFLFRHTFRGNEVSLDTRELREVLGEDVSLSDYEVLTWIGESLTEEYAVLYQE